MSDLRSLEDISFCVRQLRRDTLPFPVHTLCLGLLLFTLARGQPLHASQPLCVTWYTQMLTDSRATLTTAGLWWPWVPSRTPLLTRISRYRQAKDSCMAGYLDKGLNFPHIEPRCGPGIHSDHPPADTCHWSLLPPRPVQ